MFEKVLVSMDLYPVTGGLVPVLSGLRDFGTLEIAFVHVARPCGCITSDSLTRIVELPTGYAP